MASYTCNGCVRKAIGGRHISGVCMKCKRMTYNPEKATELKDYYEAAKFPQNAHVANPMPKAKSMTVIPTGHITITPEATHKPVVLCEKDVYAWMTKCIDRESLMRLSRYAQRRIAAIDTPARDIPPVH